MLRRSFITGLISLVAAPAIVRAGSLMPVKTMLIREPIYIPVSAGQWQDLLDAQHEINLRNLIIREYFDEGLFNPYVGGE